MRAFFVVLGGSPSKREGALELLAKSGEGFLYRCSDEFVAVMSADNKESLRLAELDKVHGDKDFALFSAHQRKLDAAWMEAGNWHKAQVGTSNKLYRTGLGRMAQEKGQPLYCWYGPPVPTYVVVTGTGPYPGKRR